MGNIERRGSVLELLELNVDEIKKCFLVRHVVDEETITELDKEDIKQRLLNTNGYQSRILNYVYNTQTRIIFETFDENKIVMAMSDCGKYIGKPTRASGMGQWFYSPNGQHVFHDL